MRLPNDRLRQKPETRKEITPILLSMQDIEADFQNEHLQLKFCTAGTLSPLTYCVQCWTLGQQQCGPIEAGWKRLLEKWQAFIGRVEVVTIRDTSLIFN
jgi:hypothetical protein